MNAKQLSIIAIAILLSSHLSASEFLSDAMKTCVKIERDLKRLACYDKLAGWANEFGADSQDSVSVPQPSRPAASPESARLSAPANPPITQKQPVRTPASPKDGFGLDTKSASDELDMIRASISGEFRGWKKGDLITLSNGQVWKILDGSLYHKATNPDVEIHRGMFGSYIMSVVGLNKASRVKRIK